MYTKLCIKSLLTFTFPSFSSLSTVIRPTRSPVAKYSPSALYSTAVIESVKT